MLESSRVQSSLTFLLRGTYIYNDQHHESPTQEFHMLLGLHSINCRPAEVTIPALNPSWLWYSFTGPEGL